MRPLFPDPPLSEGRPPWNAVEAQAPPVPSWTEAQLAGLAAWLEAGREGLPPEWWVPPEE